MARSEEKFDDATVQGESVHIGVVRSEGKLIVSREDKRVYGRLGKVRGQIGFKHAYRMT